MRPTNLVFIMSDEHNKQMLGVNGHPMVQTPTLDALAARGVNFTNAYTNCSICVPARASFATGRYVHDIGNWDNANPYYGAKPAWGHRLMAAGHRVLSIGKLHYRSTDDPCGFDEEIIPLHVVDGKGDLPGLVRGFEMRERAAAKMLSAEAGRGESTYLAYDRRIADLACEWLQNEAPNHKDKPWVLFVSFVCPHFPLIAPPEYYDLYPEDQIPMPRFYGEDERVRHPYYDAMRRAMAYDKYFDEAKIKKATAAYYGMCTFLDTRIGQVLEAVERCGLAGDTRIVYTSDHGDNLGMRGFWGKSTMYEESVGVPLIVAGPDIPEGRTVDTAVSLVDGYPTILDGAGLEPHADDRELPGRSLFELIAEPAPERVVFSEYHAAASPTGCYMIRKDRWKYVYFVGLEPVMLFDMAADPEETSNLATDPGHADVVKDLHAELLRICDPVAVDARAKADQTAMIQGYGGEEAVLARGDFGYSPAPGQTPSFAT